MGEHAVSHPGNEMVVGYVALAFYALSADGYFYDKRVCTVPVQAFNGDVPLIAASCFRFALFDCQSVRVSALEQEDYLSKSARVLAMRRCVSRLLARPCS